jgi:hypothetical protein
MNGTNGINGGKEKLVDRLDFKQGLPKGFVV